MYLVPAKLASEVSDEDASDALKRLRRIEASKPTKSQVARYAALGAGVGIAGGVIKDSIGKGTKEILGGPGKRLRTAGGLALAGALSSGGAPLLRTHFDREAEKNTLRKYVAQDQPKEARLVSESELLANYDLDELLKHAEVSVGQWWESVGGPHLAKGGDHATFKKMMDEAGFSDSVKQRFSSVAEKKYPPGHNTRRVPNPSPSSGGGGAWKRPESWANDRNPGYEPRGRTSVGTEAKEQMKQQLRSRLVGLGALGAAATLPRFMDQTKDPDQAVSHWRGTAGSALASGSGGALLGHVLGRTGLIGDTPKAKMLSTLGGGLGGAALGALVHRDRLEEAEGAGRRIGRRGAERSLSKLEGDASKSVASRVATNASNGVFPTLVGGFLGTGLGPTGLAMTGASIGGGFREDHLANAKHRAAQEAFQSKAAASAPTRGGFLMASEVPAFRAPNLRSLDQLVPQKIAMATTPAGRLASSRRVGLPKVTAPPGPSIADTVPTFGQRQPGANKTTIGKKPMQLTPTMNQV